MKCIFLVIFFGAAAFRNASSVLNCTVNFELDEDELYDYMEPLITDMGKYNKMKSITVTKNCENGTTIEDTFEFDYLMWNFRYGLFEEYVDPLEECQCEETAMRYEDCLINLVSEMTTAFNNLDGEITHELKRITDNVNAQCA